ncbi:MAG: ABC transporter [Deltaproteobacteria bacterium CG11_big_fil_rev_8_21_14_0_20_47_16]|nr:MAG: ABC transporter [Deltaproteobacteria bacterium CG11_big_fil_rev_8_21_14_0_20_47_16]
MIEVVGIQKSFGDVAAVRDISFSISKGEVVGLLGPNGAGKTTTMRILTGYLTADTGRAVIAGENVATHSLAARRKIGYLPESAPLYTDMEVTAFLSYVGRLRGIPSDQIHAAIGKVVASCGLRSVVGRDISELSKGYKQRVGLAQALIHEPEVLILDEPTSGLDPNQIIEIRKLITDLGRERTVILSTHILQEVEAMCGRALIMRQGRIVGQGTLSELAALRTGKAHYTALIRAAEKSIREEIDQCHGLALHGIRAVDGNEWQHVELTGAANGNDGEKIFQWVVANGWQLRELRAEAASLEDTFRELTQ